VLFGVKKQGDTNKPTIIIVVLLFGGDCALCVSVTVC